MAATVRTIRAGDGAALARIWLENARYDVERFRYLAPYVETRAHVEALGTADAFQRRGLATALVEAVEAWARRRGATQISATTYAASEVSTPFWERRMGYRRRGVTFVKRL